MRFHVIFPLIALLLPTLVRAQAAEEKAMQQASAVAEPYQGGWGVPADAGRKDTGGLYDAVPMRNAQQQLDHIRWERNASLARNAGTMPPADHARLVELSAALSSAAPNSFEAHMANYYAQFPAPAAFQQLELAMMKDVDREELIAPRLANAARRDNTTELTARAKDMKARGRMAPALYKVAEDILASVEPSAVLFAAGEMDAYPLWVEQFANGRQKDVLVIDERLLVDPAYRMRIWERTKARGDVSGQPGFIANLAAATNRPVYLSLALGNAAMAPLKERLYVTGLAMRLSSTPVDNIPLLEARWDRLKKPLDAGPLSKNYLVPGAVLLTHYRAIGDETRASRLEHELRGMAQKLGATSTLVKSGILEH
ncbi:MAG: hypothetical protein KF797_01030 [Flavobacteriales bacterium]|nr:hypothetical protein [Flavobacteriales bacterium]